MSSGPKHHSLLPFVAQIELNQEDSFFPSACLPVSVRCGPMPGHCFVTPTFFSSTRTEYTWCLHFPQILGERGELYIWYTFPIPFMHQKSLLTCPFPYFPPSRTSDLWKGESHNLLTVYRLQSVKILNKCHLTNIYNLPVSQVSVILDNRFAWQCSLKQGYTIPNPLE